MTNGNKETHHKPRIDCLEGLALIVALETWAPILANRDVAIHGDNQTQVRATVRGYSGSPHIQTISQEINDMCAAIRTTSHVHWIPSKYNIADRATRGHRYKLYAHTMILDAATLPANTIICFPHIRGGFNAVLATNKRKAISSARRIQLPDEIQKTRPPVDISNMPSISTDTTAPSWILAKDDWLANSTPPHPGSSFHVPTQKPNRCPASTAARAICTLKQLWLSKEVTHARKDHLACSRD